VANPGSRAGARNGVLAVFSPPAGAGFLAALRSKKQRSRRPSLALRPCGCARRLHRLPVGLPTEGRDGRGLQKPEQEDTPMTLIETLLPVLYAYLAVATLALHLELARRVWRHIRFRRFVAAKAR
jgi:hypothetical protein